MRIDVVGKDVAVSDAERAHAVEKGEKLPRYFDGTQQVTFTFSKAGSHDAVVECECVVDVEKHKPFVSHGKHEDVSHALDEAVSKVTRQLTDFKERLKNEKR